MKCSHIREILIYLFIYNLFNYAVKNWVCVASNGKVINE
jgi:hypothetical protein